jgi:hypothetical protein
VKNVLDLSLASIVAVCAGLLAYGLVLYPDAPIHPCGDSQFCGKRNQPHTEQQYRAFLAWEKSLLILAPFGFAAGFVLNRRSQHRSSIDWNRLRALQPDLSRTSEEQRYAAAWKDLRRRELTAHVFLLPPLLWAGWALFQASTPVGGFFAPLPLTLLALFAGSELWSICFRCPRCNKRYYLVQATVSAHSDQCAHCGLRRGATFEQALAELKK